MRGRLQAGVAPVPTADDVTTVFAPAFTAKSGALVGQDYISSLYTVQNISAPGRVVTITGGTYSKNGGAYTAGAGVASNGDTFRVKGQASAALNTIVDVVLTIDGVAGTYRITSETTARPLLSALSTSVPRGAWSHEIRWMSTFVGNLCTLIINDVTSQTFSYNAANRIDYKAVTTWADSVDPAALIRIQTCPNQGTLGVGATFDATQATDIDRPILDRANYDPVTGFWPASLTGYAASVAAEQNLFLTVGAGLTHNQGNHDQVAVIEPMTNVAVSSTNNLSIQTLGASVATSNELNLGNHSFAGQFGLNVNWGSGPTKTFPNTTMLVPANISWVMEGMSTVVSSLDGITVGASQARVHLSVNGVHQFMGPVARTSGASTGMRIGSGVSGADTGTGFRWHGSLSYNNYIEADAVGNRATLGADMIAMFGINTAYDAQVLIEGSSTPVGYRSRARGFGLRLKALLDGTPRVDVIAQAGTATSVMAANAAAIAALKIAGFAKYAALLIGTARNDINQAVPPTAAAIYADMKTWVNAHLAQGFTCYVATVVNTQYTSVAQATGDALCAAVNALIRAGSGVDGFTVVDCAALAEAADYTNVTYFDPDQIHGNDSTVGLIQAKAALAASIMNVYL